VQLLDSLLSILELAHALAVGFSSFLGKNISSLSSIFPLFQPPEAVIGNVQKKLAYVFSRALLQFPSFTRAVLIICDVNFPSPAKTVSNRVETIALANKDRRNMIII
jgi:hypothetical protein